MDKSIADLKSTTFFGRRFTRKQIEQIKKTVNIFKNLSLSELAHTICEHFDWFTDSGTNRIHTCLGTLKELEKHGVITLPAKIESKKRSPQKKIAWTEKTNEQSIIGCELKDLMPITLQVISEKQEATLWNEFVDRHHYLGYKRPIGNHLRYYIVDKNGRKLGCMLFSFATTSLNCRDEWIGWDNKARQKRLKLVINNNRFLIFPWVNVKNLASKALSIVTKQITQDWLEAHGYQPVLLETFVDSTRYRGSCYKAANWVHIGKSKGRKATANTEGKSQKETYVYSLHSSCKIILMKGEDALPKKKMRKKLVKEINLDLDDPYIHLWQKIITVICQISDNFDQEWQKRKRVINTMILILFILRLVFSKNQQGYDITIIELWDQCRFMNIPLPQPQPVSKSSISAARKKLDPNIFKIINSEVIEVYDVASEEKLWCGHRIFATDGSKINLPRQLLEDGYALPTKKSHYPQGMTSCLYQLKSQIPVDFDLVSHGNERTVALTHLAALKKNDIVVYDRGYFSYVMLRAHLDRGLHCVFRLKITASAGITEFFNSDDIERVIYYEPGSTRKHELRAEHPGIEITPLKLRLVKYERGGTIFMLGTTLFDNQKYTMDKLADLYHSRWGIEELFKISKNLIDVEDFHARSEIGVKQELFSHFTMITLCRIFSNHVESGYEKSIFNDASKKFKANFKNCLTTLSRHMENLMMAQVNMVQNAVNAILSCVSDCRQKVRPGRSYERVSRKPVKKWTPERKKSAA